MAKQLKPAEALHLGKELANLHKIRRTVYSCTTAHHLNAAQRMFDNYKVKYPERDSVRESLKVIKIMLKARHNIIVLGKKTEVEFQNGQIKL